MQLGSGRVLLAAARGHCAGTRSWAARPLGVLLCLGAIGGGLPQIAGATEPPPIQHVFLIVLENEEG